jgi:hypothetical protein
MGKIRNALSFVFVSFVNALGFALVCLVFLVRHPSFLWRRSLYRRISWKERGSESRSPS